MSWFGYISISVILLVVFTIVSRLTLSKTTYEKAYTIIWQAFFALTAVLFLPFEPFKFSTNPKFLLLLFLAAAFYVLYNNFLFQAFKYEEASVLAPINSLSNVFVILISITVLKAHTTLIAAAGIILILFSTYLISFYKYKLKVSKGVIFAILGAVAVGIATSIDGSIVGYYAIPIYMLISGVFKEIIGQAIVLHPSWEKIVYEFKAQKFKIMFSAVALGISYYALLKAFTLGNIPQVIAINSSSTILITIAGILFLKERDNIFLKIVAAIIAAVGVVLVSF